MKVVSYPLQTKPYSSVRFSSHSFQFHYIFCWLCYYLLLLPYRFEIIQNECRVRKHALQKVLCMTLLFSALVIETLDLRRIFIGQKLVERPTKLFEIALYIALWFYVVVFIRLGLFKERNFKEIISTFSWSNGSSKCKDKCAAIGLCLFGVSSTVFHIIEDTFWLKSFQNVLQSMAGQLYFLIFLRDNNSPLHEKELSLTTKVFTVVFAICEFYRRLSNHFVEILFYISCISVYRLVNDFLIVLRVHPNLCAIKISQCYDDMKTILNNINSVGGSFVVVMFVVGVPYFSGKFSDRLDYDSGFLRVDYLHYALLYLIAYTFAAEANYKMQEFKDYLMNLKRNENNVLNAEKLSLLLLEESSSPIGLKGYGFFTVTYGFLGTVFSILVTYMIILLQFQMSQNKT